ncbi:MAG: SPOR domain-containing protein [Betaproteobacteria bacterium]|nr:MAG: SPOR domain-containing protein [Betaproteobacteria bacterium]
MAKESRTVAKKKNGGSTLLGVFIGLILGLCLAVGVAWYMNKTPIPFLTKAKPPEKAEAVPGKTIVKPDEKTTQQVEKPRFEFYKILPGAETPVTEQQIKQAAKPGAPVENYLLQVGSFQNPADADNLKARLALIGVEAGVEPIDLPEKGTWYRVRVGPYTKVDEINRVRQNLAQNGIEATLVKIKDPGSH